jgi:histidyl-tRNA synthetase
MSISTKPPSGFRDFLPADVRRRNHVFGVIEDVYRSYGFEQLDTPAMERLTTLLGKYGEEGDQLLFRTLLRGQKLTRALEEEDPDNNSLADMGLRYDLTVPLARVYAEYRNDFPRIFKRFQIAPVWRADRPQKGRYREFYQCDVDIIGSSSMTVEAEVTAALAEILERLEFEGFRIHVNHRGVLSAMMDVAGVPGDRHGETLTVLDKLDKIGRDGVRDGLDELGLDDDAIELLTTAFPMIESSGDDFAALNEETLSGLTEHLGDHEEGSRAVEELRQILAFTKRTPAAPYLVLDAYLARGLSYYTGPIFEIRSDDFSGSLGGGGRYDELIGMFMKEDVPACGFSLGVERILFLMEERGMFDESRADVDVLVTMWNDDTAPETLKLAHELRTQGVKVDVYTKGDRYGKQFGYADDRNIPFVIILGPDEIEAGTVAIKNMKSGDQIDVDRAEIVDHLVDRI